MKIEVRPIVSEAERQACLQIREVVFIGEQAVPTELERDEYDEKGATHFIALVEDMPMGTGRLRVADAGEQKWAKVQRVAVLSVARGTGLGKALMSAMEQHVAENALAQGITLGAQLSAKRFYTKLGYAPHGEEFDDAGIRHIEMRKEV
ncbi:MAG: GNAT family N-acetyltransferase [Pseudomonadota bacterium]